MSALERRELAEWLADAYTDAAAGCPPPEAYLEAEMAALSAEQRRRLEAHADGCPACQAERELARAFDEGEAGVAADDLAWVLEQARPAAKPAGGIPATGRVVPFHGRRAPTWNRYAAAAVLAMGIGVTYFALHDRGPSLPAPPSGGLVRGGEVEAVSPLGEVAEVPVELRWEPTPGAASYRVRILAVDGDTVWAGEAAAPPARLPGEVVARLQRSVSYDWVVDAIGRDGRRLGSGAARFRVRSLPESATD